MSQENLAVFKRAVEAAKRRDVESLQLDFRRTAPQCGRSARLALVSASKPVLIAVDDDPAALARIRGELDRRYGQDYRVVCGNSPETAIARLEEMRAAGESVALVLADVWMAEQQGSEMLDRVRRLHPHAKRALLIDWGAWGHRPTADALLHAMATGRIDYYVLKPARDADEQFHRIVAEFLHEWARENSAVAHELSIVADPAESRTHQIRDLLKRSGVPHGFEPSQGMAPTLRMRDGRELRDPSNEEIVAAFGVDTEQVAESEFDRGGRSAPARPACRRPSTPRRRGCGTLVVEREAASAARPGRAR